MTRALPIAFLFWYLRRGLFGPGVIGATLLLGLAVAAVVAPALAGSTVAFGWRRVQLADVPGQPLALCLWVGDKHSSDLLTPAKLDVLKAALERRLGPTGWNGAAFPYYEVRGYGWSRSRDGDLSYLEGRTIAPGDPVRVWAAGRLGTRPPHRAGVVVTREMLGFLGAEGACESVFVKLPSSGREEVPIAGIVVAEERLPLGYLFLLPGELEQELLTRNPDTAFRTVSSGPLPSKLARCDTYPPALQKRLGTVFDRLKLRWPPDVTDNGFDLFWQLHATADPPLRSSWSAYRKIIRDVLADSELRAAADDLVLDFPEVKQEPPPRPAYHVLALDSRDEGEFLERLAACREAGVPLMEQSERIAEQMKAITARAERYQQWFYGALLALVPGLLVMLTILQRIRAGGRTVELGYLEALGVGRGTLTALVLAEAGVVWLLGAVVGAGLFAAVLPLVNGLLAPAGAGFALADVPWLPLLAVFLAPGLACSASALWGAWSPCRDAPMVTLHHPAAR